MSVAWARSSEPQAPKPRPPGTSASTSRSRSPDTWVSGSICMCTYLGVKYLRQQVYRTNQPWEGASMSTDLQLDLDPSVKRRFGTVAGPERVARAAAALEANGIRVLRAASAVEAKRIVLDVIPDGSQVHNGASLTLEVSGITEAIATSGRYDAVRPRVMSMDRATQADEIR